MAKGVPRDPAEKSRKLREAALKRGGCKVGCTCRRHKRSEETRRKIGDGNRGKIRTEEMKKQWSESSKTHGMKYHQSYRRWYDMMLRCYGRDNWAYKYYGARGIEVYGPWHDVATFCNWLDENLGPCPEGMSIDRIDNDGNYEPGNVRWATRKEQRANRRDQ